MKYENEEEAGGHSKRDESRSKARLKMNEEKWNGAKDNARGYRTQVAQAVVRALQRW